NPAPVHGKVYVFDVSTGRMLYEIAPSPPFHFEFHARVAVGGDWVVVGEGRADGGGAVHVYDRATGRKLYRLHGGHNGHWDFGTGVSVSQGRVIVGAPSALGRVYVYDAPTGELLFEQGPFGGGLGASFGTDLGTSGSRVAVGAQWDGPAG